LITFFIINIQLETDNLIIQNCVSFTSHYQGCRRNTNFHSIKSACIFPLRFPHLSTTQFTRGGWVFSVLVSGSAGRRFKSRPWTLFRHIITLSKLFECKFDFTMRCQQHPSDPSFDDDCRVTKRAVCLVVLIRVMLSLWPPPGMNDAVNIWICWRRSAKYSGSRPWICSIDQLMERGHAPASAAVGLEHLAAWQTINYLAENRLLPKLQSVYRINHSTETALLSTYRYTTGGRQRWSGCPYVAGLFRRILIQSTTRRSYVAYGHHSASETQISPALLHTLTAACSTSDAGAQARSLLLWSSEYLSRYGFAIYYAVTWP